MKNKLCLIGIGLLTLTSLAFGGTEGHGGDAVLKNGKYYLLDLVEAGLETSGKIDSDYKYCMGAATDVNNGRCHWYPQYSSNGSYQSLFGKDVYQAITNNLVRLPDFEALIVLQTMGLFNWNFVSLPLTPIRDVHSPIDLSVTPIYQLAIRTGRTITVNSLIWNQMDTLNKAALITHEALYAMVRPVASVNNAALFGQDSYIARQFNAELYREGVTPRLRTEMTANDYSFTLYQMAFGSYGEADDYIGHDVFDQGSLVNKRFVSTGAYVKLEGALQSNLVPGQSPETVVREKMIFFKEGASDICGQLLANTGKFNVKLSLVRTLFTTQLGSYASENGPSSFSDVAPAEMSFSKWYQSRIGVGTDSVTISAADRPACELAVKNAAGQFEALMQSAPDYIARWDDAH